MTALRQIAVCSLPLLWCAATLLLIGGCASNGITPDAQASLDRADRIDRLLKTASVDQRSAKLSKYLQLVGQRLIVAAREMDRQHLGPSTHFDAPATWMLSDNVQFHLLADPEPNSFSTGGRYVYITTSLLDACQTEADLAAVMAHAYAHLYDRDWQRRIPYTESRDDSALLRPIANFQYSPEDEREADDTAFSLYARAGWDPRTYPPLWKRIAERSGLASVAAEIGERSRRAQWSADHLSPAASDWRQPPVADPRRFTERQAEARDLASNQRPTEQAVRAIAVQPNCILLKDDPRRLAARQQLAPPPLPANGNEWGKGLPPPQK